MVFLNAPKRSLIAESHSQGVKYQRFGLKHPDHLVESLWMKAPPHNSVERDFSCTDLCMKVILILALSSSTAEMC